MLSLSCDLPATVVLLHCFILFKEVCDFRFSTPPPPFFIYFTKILPSNCTFYSSTFIRCYYFCFLNTQQPQRSLIQLNISSCTVVLGLVSTYRLWRMAVCGAFTSLLSTVWFIYLTFIYIEKSISITHLHILNCQNSLHTDLSSLYCSHFFISI